MDQFIRDSNRHFIHFFVNDEILFRNIDEFITLRKQTTVLTDGPGRRFESFNVLDISMSESEIRNRILQTQLVSRYEDPDERQVRRQDNFLSSREKEVLKLIIKGLINKEIAEVLKISVPTVIFHRNNICEKLQTRSIGKLTIFAVLSGIMDINEI
jgi:DNA-binding CsgD family transcriptional regulator